VRRVQALGAGRRGAATQRKRIQRKRVGSRDRENGVVLAHQDPRGAGEGKGTEGEVRACEGKKGQGETRGEGQYFPITTFRLPVCPYSYQKGLLPCLFTHTQYERLTLSFLSSQEAVAAARRARAANRKTTRWSLFITKKTPSSEKVEQKAEVIDFALNLGVGGGESSEEFWSTSSSDESDDESYRAATGRHACQVRVFFPKPNAV
jgi:hypothetical protein